MDRYGNIVTIRVHDNNVGSKSFARGKDILKMYNLRGDHFIVTRYVGSSLFEFRIFSVILEGIQCPARKGVSFGVSVAFSINFFNCFGSALKLKEVKIYRICYILLISLLYR